MWGFSSTPTSSLTPAGGPKIQFNFDPLYLELASDPTNWGFSPTRLPSPPRHTHTNIRCQAQVQPSTDQLRGSHNPLLGFDNLLEWLTKLRNTLYLPLSIYCKRYNSATAKRKRCVGQGVWEGAQSLHALSVPSTLPALQCVHLLGSPSNLFS